MGIYRPRAVDTRLRITLEQRHQLLQIYLHMGREEAARASAEAGVASGYAARIAHEMGLGHRVVFGGSR